jgi:tetratricopeptide (TPR) repeat protein
LYRGLVFLSIFSAGLLPAQDFHKVDSLELALQLSQPNTNRVDINLALAEELKFNQSDRAIEFAENAIVLSDSLRYSDGKLIARRILAEIYWNGSDYKNALKQANEAIKVAEKKDIPLETAKIYIVYGLTFSDLGEYDKSSGYFFKSLKIFEESGSEKGTSRALNSIGYLYFEQGYLDKALDYYSQALAISRKLDDPFGIARGLNNIAAVYGNKQDFSNVKRYLLEAVRFNLETGQKRWEGINYLNLGEVNRDQLILDSSFYYYKKAVNVFKDINFNFQLANAYIGLSRYYEDLKDTDNSLKYAKMAFSLGLENNLIKLKARGSNRLFEIYKVIGDKENTYTYGLLYYQFKDSLEIEKSITRISQLELIYEYDKITQQQKIEEQQKELVYIITIVSLIFLLVLIVILLVFRQKIRSKNALLKRKELEKELELKNKELTSNVMSLLKKNEILSEIGDKLMEVQNEAVKDETKSAIIRIAKDLQKTNDNEIWEEFEVRFKQAHSDFYHELNLQFPNLSPNELKLCAFLRLNLSSKEISELTGQRISTLEIARSRLRKKLGISNQKINLVTFLSQI